MSAAKKIQAAVKLTDQEIQEWEKSIHDEVKHFKPTVNRARQIREMGYDMHTILDGEMDVRNNFKAPIASYDLQVLIMQWLIDLGYIPDAGPGRRDAWASEVTKTTR